MVYRFKFTSDRYPKFSFEVEVQESQTFYDFHEFIQDELEYDTSHLATFHVCNHSWQSKQEVVLLKKSKQDANVLLMDKTLLKPFIKDAHQKLLYCYDLINNRSFKIELAETKTETTNMYYPICTAFTGEIPPQFDSGKNDSIFDIEDDDDNVKKPKKPVIDVFDDEFSTDEPFDKDIDFGFTPEDQDIEPDEEEEEDEVKEDPDEDLDEDDMDPVEGDDGDNLDDDDD